MAVCPDGTVSSDKWVLGETSQLCSDACSAVGLLCDADAQTLTTDATVTAAFAEVGVDCSTHDISYRDYAGVPLQHDASHVNCYGNTPGSTSTCNVPHAYSGNKVLCRCVVTVGEETCVEIPQPSQPSCTTDPKLTAAASSAYHIDGGGWRLVRRVAPSNNAWHPAIDSLLGTASYGTATIDETADTTFSTPFTADASTEFLFATGDAQKWLIATGAQIGGVFNGDYYSNSNRAFQLSSDGVRGLKAVVFGHDDMDMTGQMSQNMGAKVYDFSDQSGFTIVTKIKWTASVYYENFFALQHADTSFYAAINRFGTSSDLYVGFIDSNGVSCGSPYAGNPQTHGLYTPSNAWFLLKIKYEHASKTLCQYVDSVEKCHTCASNFVLPSTVTLENWL